MVDVFKIKDDESVSLISSYLALNEQVLAMAADQGFREEGSKVDHDLSQKRANRTKSNLASQRFYWD